MNGRPRVPVSLELAAQVAWRVVVVAVALVLVGYLMLRLRLAVLPAIFALFAAAIVVPPVRWLQLRRIPRGLATVIVFLAFAGFAVGVGFLLAPGIQEEFGDLGPVVSEGIQDIQDWISTGPLGISEDSLEDAVQGARDWFDRNRSALVAGVLSGAALAVEIIAGFLLLLVLTFFYVKDGERIVDWFLGHVPTEHKDLAVALGRRTWRVLGAYWRGTATVGLFDALFIGLGLVVLGVPLVAPLMLLTFFAAFFPLIGAPMAGLIAALVALVTGGIVKALIVVAIVVAVQQVEGNVLHPLVLGRVMSLHPIVILLALTAGAVLAGIVGAFLAVPVTAVLAAAGNELKARSATR